VTKITFSQKAIDALVSQAKYIYQLTLNIQKADLYLDEMETYITHTLKRHPLIGRAAPELGQDIRKLVYKKYSILYRITELEIKVLIIYKENLPNL
jgi:plasmid stabilization system protein ParE